MGDHKPRVGRATPAGNVVRFINGLSVLLDGTARGQMGNAPKESVFKEWKLEVHHVLPRRADEHPLGDDADFDATARFPTPVLLIPPLMVRPYVYDLRPDHSMVRALRDRGFDVYVVDFGVPDRLDSALRLEHYVFTFLPSAIDAVLRHSGAPDVSLVGYCMGGIFALLYTAAFSDPAHTGRRCATRNLVTIGAPINFEKLGILTLAARLGHAHVDTIMDRLGNVPSIGAELGFKLMGGRRTLTKWADLFIHLYDEEYVRGFDAINTWVNDLLPYPREAFKQMVKDVVGQNKLLKRELVLAERPIDLARIAAPLLALAGRTDNIATLGSTRDVLATVGSTDKTFVEVPGGHVGVVGGSAARREVWERAADWLAPRSLDDAPADG
jgi:polyhydroxyalkanoate synthase